LHHNLPRFSSAAANPSDQRMLYRLLTEEIRTTMLRKVNWERSFTVPISPSAKRREGALRYPASGEAGFLGRHLDTLAVYSRTFPLPKDAKSKPVFVFLS
jgi:hypothetical protein